MTKEVRGVSPLTKQPWKARKEGELIIITFPDRTLTVDLNNAKVTRS